VVTQTLKFDPICRSHFEMEFAKWSVLRPSS
jgi:hypothetical protein